ncbi:hypothetical protein [Rickettsia asembonensis]|uniref:hypothetical protein n=1 Tax=Rickettsia asembonensis TaxID=1068590 RepID=UPI0018F201BB|nr:hypothetical protein [Rickettsia asembonensis]
MNTRTVIASGRRPCGNPVKMLKISIFYYFFWIATSLRSSQDIVTWIPMSFPCRRESSIKQDKSSF